MIWLWFSRLCIFIIIPLCELACWHRFWDTDMRMAWYEIQLRLAPARCVEAEVSSGVWYMEMCGGRGFFRRVIHGRRATPGFWTDIQRGLIITADVYLRTDMHHDYITSSSLHLHYIWSHLCVWVWNYLIALQLWLLIYLLLFDDLRLVLIYGWLYLLKYTCWL